MPTMILFNGKIYAPQPATAIAIGDGKIQAVGRDADIRRLKTPATREIDLNGRRVLPGITDGHIHLFKWALGRLDVNLAGADSLDDLQRRLAERAARTPAGQWIKGSGWNESEWSPAEMPTRADLDAVTTEHPVIFWRADLHAAVVNSRALDIAGIAATRRAPVGGVIDRDDAGKPTGILKELAIDLVSRHLPKTDDATARAALLDGIAALHRLGITGVHDQRMMGGNLSRRSWRALQSLDRDGRLKLRVTSNVHYSDLPKMIDLGLQPGFGSECLRFGFVKMFSDGSMGAHTAWMLHPYEDAADTGMAAMPPETIAAVTREASAHGWAVSVHAIGDRANREVLDILAETAAVVPAPHFPHRIEHAQLLHPDDISRFARLGVTVSVQPVHLLDDIAKMNVVWGARSEHAFPFKRLLENGAQLAFGSDAPVADPNPWFGIHAAVNRRKPDGTPEGGYFPTERLSVAQAVDAYTQANAAAVGLSDKQGRIEPGKWADLVVLAQDIFDIDPMTLADTTVWMTLFNGEIVFAAD